MSPKKKVHCSIAESENLLQELHDNLEEDTLFGHSFIGEDDSKKHESWFSDTNIEEIVDVELIDEVEFVNEAEAVPRKQKFFNLYDVLNLEKYVLLEQEPSQFHYTDSKGQFTMNWRTAKQ